jgi:alkylated DNA repair dioxygenase AlkB
MTATPSQSGLFDDLPIPADQLPDGLRLQEGFLSREEEAQLLDIVTALPLAAARYKQYTARRQVISYGGSFDYDTNRLEPAQPLIEALHPLRDRVAAWAGVTPESLVHTLVAAYTPGTPLGWHRDVPEFEQIFGVSLGGPATLRFRPYPPVSPRKEEVVRLQVEPRAVYAITGVARWGWQHSVAPVDAMRWSITFRTPRAGQRPR